MANLSSLVHELRERVAASSSTPPNKENDEALEARFRAVLPSLLHTYVVPSAAGILSFYVFDKIFPTAVTIGELLNLYRT